ncbi:MAG TPA: response regulator [Thermoanaerobaculia bacterium]|nr:response regulator [Thermoanaerobaculia bacterium]
MSSEQYRRVLIVDDDAVVREILHAALRQKALVVDIARDGQEAIDFLRQHSYAVVLLDLLMPVTDGFGVLDAMAEGTGTIVLIITAADRGVIEQLDARRIHGVVRKPFDPNDLAAIVEACADIRGMRQYETSKT